MMGAPPNLQRTDRPMHRRHFISLMSGAAPALAGCSASKDFDAAEAGVTRFRELMREGKYAEIYQESGDELKRGSTEQQFTALLAAIERKLGAVKESKRGGWNVNWNNLITTATLNFKTQFEKGSGEEKFSFRISGGKALLTGYQINSQEMMVN